MTLVLLLKGVGGPAGFSLTASPGSYAISGVAASTVATRLIAADPGAYALTGVAASTVAGYILSLIHI